MRVKLSVVMVSVSVMLGWMPIAHSITHELHGVQVLNVWFPVPVQGCKDNAVVIMRREEIQYPPRTAHMYAQSLPTKVTPGKISCLLGTLDLPVTIKLYKPTGETIPLIEGYPASRFSLSVVPNIIGTQLMGTLEYTPLDPVQKLSEEQQRKKYREALNLLMAAFPDFRETGIPFQTLVYEP